MSGTTSISSGALLRQSTGITSDRKITREAPFDGVLGESRVLRSTLDYVRSLAAQDHQNVLLVGGPGTGKALLAKALHNTGPKAHLPFLAVDCSSATGSLETDLFGYEAGAYEGITLRKRGLFELAGGGTVFLENIENLPVRLQPKLMHALARRAARRVGGRETFAVKATIIASTVRPLEVLVAEGAFREDLFFELNSPRVSVPSLAERDEDVVFLAQRFLDETARAQGLRPMSLTVDAHSALLAYDWPGNVRELRTVIRRAAERCDGPLVTRQHLQIDGPTLGSPRGRRRPQAVRTLREIERAALLEALERADGRTADAAKALDISHEDLLSKTRDHSLRASVALET